MTTAMAQVLRDNMGGEYEVLDDLVSHFGVRFAGVEDSSLVFVAVKPSLDPFAVGRQISNFLLHDERAKDVLETFRDINAVKISY